jgi:hypothetical protein
MLAQGALATKKSWLAPAIPTPADSGVGRVLVANGAPRHFCRRIVTIQHFCVLEIVASRHALPFFSSEKLLERDGISRQGLVCSLLHWPS